MERKPVIELRDVKKTYRVGSVKVPALRGVDLTVVQGEVCCIIGRSGSGKSTMLNMLAGLEQVSAGEVVITGLHLERMTQGELIAFRQQHVGFIFQSFNLMPYYTALENVAFPLSFRGMPKAKRLSLAKDALSAVDLASHMRHKPSQLSGGQQQRVAIARAMVTDPEIIFADEPTGNLDSNTSDDVMRSMCQTVRSRNKTLVMVTHDPHIADFADRVVQILDGRVVGITENPQQEEVNHAEA